MVGRPREFDRAAALDAAMKVFWQHGYERAPMETLLSEMGIGRGSFYAAFESKHRLYVEALERFADRAVARFRKVLLEPGGPLLENLRNFVRSWPEFARNADGKGCFVTNALIERAPTDQDVAQIVRRLLREEELLMHGVLSQARDAGDLPASRDPGMIARAIVNARLGITLHARLGSDGAFVTTAVETVLAMLSRDTA